MPAIPCLRYQDAAAAIEWLCRAFGFDRHLVVPGPSGGIAHAELTHGDAMIMLGSTGGPYDALVYPPEKNGGVCTQTLYLVVSDPDAHYRRAVAAGAPVVTPIEDKPQGGRGYICRDPEGNLWNFGSYDPFKPAARPAK
ncbi:MAG TPA: VOC family protein [Myxococcota bacterium]|nr:VOC family protein [Myxococcota bacterium]